MKRCAFFIAVLPEGGAAFFVVINRALSYNIDKIMIKL